MSTSTKQKPGTHSYQYLTSCSQRPTFSSCFSLVVRQQPIQARQSTATERDRQPVDPPPIIQVKHKDPVPQDLLQNPYLFMCASLAHHERDEMRTGISGRSVSSVYKLKDYDNNDCGFFVFGDLSVLVEGQYRIKFTLFEITLHGAVSLNSVYSDPFSVYSSKTFPGLLESTFLSRSFSDQGVRLRIRKEHRVQIKRPPKRKSVQVWSSSAGEQHQQHRHRPSSPPPPPHHLMAVASPSKHQRLSIEFSWSSTADTKEPVIRLPPIRDIMPSLSKARSSPSSSAGANSVEVDPPVAMMQLHLHRNSAVW